MNNSKLVIILGVVIGVIGLVFGFTHVGPQGPSGRDGQVLGANPGPDINFPSQCINGVCRYYYRSGFASATTTACVFRSPTATSSVVFFHVQPITATTSAFTAVLATSTTNNVSLNAFSAIASTTQLATQLYAANSAAAFVYEPSNIGVSVIPALVGASTTPWVLPPNTFVIYAAQGGGVISSGSSQAQAGGTCSAVLASFGN